MRKQLHLALHLFICTKCLPIHCKYNACLEHDGKQLRPSNLYLGWSPLIAVQDCIIQLLVHCFLLWMHCIFFTLFDIVWIVYVLLHAILHRIHFIFIWLKSSPRRIQRNLHIAINYLVVGRYSMRWGSNKEFLPQILWDQIQQVQC